MGRTNYENKTEKEEKRRTQKLEKKENAACVLRIRGSAVTGSGLRNVDMFYKRRWSMLGGPRAGRDTRWQATNERSDVWKAEDRLADPQYLSRSGVVGDMPSRYGEGKR